VSRQPVVAGLSICWLILTFALFASAQSPSTSAQTDDQTPNLAKFHTESRQVLVEANVWNPGIEKHATDLKSKPDLQYPKGWPTPARGLNAKDFRVFDNGVEQRVNFLKELDFDARWSDPWLIEPDVCGAWGIYEPGTGWDATATYLIGYAPPSLQPGECHSVSVVVQNHNVDLNRTEYCSSNPAGSELQAQATAAEGQMQALANLHGERAAKLSIRAFSLWSSGVLRLLAEPPSESGLDQPASEYKYVVQVHDAKAPATVHIAAEFQWRDEEWETSDCFKKNPSVHILGTVYQPNGKVETQFKDSFSCLSPLDTQSTQWKYGVKHGWFARTAIIPTRFHTQLELPPGYYRLRVFVSDGKSVGEAVIPLHVETFDKDRFGVSDIILAGIVRDASSLQREAASVYPAPMNPTPLVSKDVQFLPTVDSHVPKHTPLSFYFEIYEPLLETQMPTVSFSVRITNLKSNSLVMNTGPMSAGDWVVAGNAVIPIGLQLNVDKLKRGSYRLEVQASDSGGRESEWRAANFNIQ
jgi:hypothetical protein